MGLFINDEKRAWEDLGAGVSRKVMSYNADLMVVKVRFEVGSIGAGHQHPHTQISYVESGTFEYTIADETFTIEAGDTCLIPPNTLHGCHCINAGILVDAFSPVREDFL
ncbi:cupin domain-containing protein [Parapedobacter tibetensis]|uniref:cupin domain-containing protein n=1 Tax=Parapedobacter tibetensis TaxID=2972951 RepID=UPI00214D4547|nr:cupin domain-containing protein [Parapedobacter tibetensis]